MTPPQNRKHNGSFLTYTHDDITYIEFDTSMCVPPEPMINGMIALEKKLCRLNDESHFSH